MKNYEIQTQQFSTFGDKLLQHADRLNEIQNYHVIRPITIQLAPTEFCDSDCPFCSVQNRPAKEKVPFDVIKKGLTDFRALGAKSLELTGGGNPLMYRDGSRTINHVIECAHELGYEIGVITNTEKIRRHINPDLAPLIKWIRVSLIKLDEGKDPDSYDFSGFDEKIGLSYIIYNRTTRETIERISQVVELNPSVRFVRLAANCLTEESITVKEQWGSLINEIDSRGKMFIKEIGDNFHAYPGGCWIGAIRPYWVWNGVYICTSHVLIHRNYNQTWKLCDSDKITEKWADMNSRLRRGEKPYEINIYGDCRHCYYANNNRLLSAVINELPDKNFA